jgi:hypothetical protein
MRRLGLRLQPAQKPLEEALGRRRIPAILHEDVEHDPVLIHSSPYIEQRAVDPDKRLVEMPGVAGLRLPLPEPSGEVCTEFPAQCRILSWVTVTPRSTRISSTSRKLRLKT